MKIWYCPNCGYEVGARGRCHLCRHRLVASPLAQLEPGADEDEVGYRLDEWADRTRGRLIEALVADDVAHRFEGDELVVAVEDELRTDVIVERVTATAELDGLPEGADPSIQLQERVADEIDEEVESALRQLLGASTRLRQDPTDMEADGEVAEASTGVFMVEGWVGADDDTWSAVGRVTRRLLAALGSDEALEEEITTEAAVLATLLQPLLAGPEVTHRDNGASPDGDTLTGAGAGAGAGAGVGDADEGGIELDDRAAREDEAAAEAAAAALGLAPTGGAVAVEPTAGPAAAAPTAGPAAGSAGVGGEADDGAGGTDPATPLPGATSPEPGAASPEPGAASPEPGAASPEPVATSPEPVATGAVAIDAVVTGDDDAETGSGEGVVPDGAGSLQPEPEPATQRSLLLGGAPETAYEAPEWLPDQRALLSVLLERQSISHVWDGTDLVVLSADEEAVEALFDKIGGVADADDDGARYRAIEDLFAAVSRLVADPDDEIRGADVVRHVGAVEGPTPFGFDDGAWLGLRRRSRTLADAVEHRAHPDVISGQATALRDALRSFV